MNYLLSINKFIGWYSYLSFPGYQCWPTAVDAGSDKLNQYHRNNNNYKDYGCIIVYNGYADMWCQQADRRTICIRTMCPYPIGMGLQVYDGTNSLPFNCIPVSYAKS